jgi:Rv2525c-like, glycoside hydrolase-like domain
MKKKPTKKRTKKRVTRKRAQPSRTRSTKQPKRKPRATKSKPRRPAVAPLALVARSAGFDCGSYPGDAAINTWAVESPYGFVGFYFDAPCHTTATFKTWSGKFPVVQAAGLGLAVVYVGFQQDGCGKTKLSRAKGLAHGQDTVTKFGAEGFQDGTIVFLDIEHYDGTLSGPMEAYVRGWLSAILDAGNVGPGIYCPASKANEIRLAAEKEFAAHGLPGGTPAFWIVKTSSLFDPATSNPADCGISFAKVWQGRLDISETHGEATITIDQNVADSRDPSGAI